MTAKPKNTNTEKVGTQRIAAREIAVAKRLTPFEDLTHLVALSSITLGRFGYKLCPSFGKTSLPAPLTGDCRTLAVKYQDLCPLSKLPQAINLGLN